MTEIKLLREIEEVEAFFCKIDINYKIRCTKDGYKIDFPFLIKVINYLFRSEYMIDFFLPITVYVLAGKEVLPQIGFNFSLIIPQKFPDFPLKIIAYGETNPLFHPHFKLKRGKVIPGIGNKYAEWIDYENNTNEKITDLLKKVIYSLQYNVEYMDPSAEKIGNQKANDWYLKKYHSNKQFFQIDKYKINLPVISDSKRNNQKKFQINEPNNIHSRNEFTSMQSNKKKFIIDENIPGYRPIESELKIEENEIHKHIYDSLQIGTLNPCKFNCLLYICAYARDQLFDHIKWGNAENKINKVEQGGLLLGNVYYEKEKNIQYAIVERIVMGSSAQGNAVHLEMDHNTWKEMIDQVDKILDEKVNEHLHIIGWYHTHPNNLEIFMSDTDKNTQERFFNNDWQYAIILNPHRKIWKAFYGKRGNECLVLFEQDAKDNTPENSGKEEHTFP
jgi:proteasome lid subunit RPN8/RPN11